MEVCNTIAMSNDSVIAVEKTFQESDNEEESSVKNVCTKPFRIFIAKSDTEVLEACQVISAPVLVENFQIKDQPEDGLSVFVLDSFEDVQSNGSNYRILGRTALLELAQKQSSMEISPFLSSLRKPLYCHSLSGKVICFTGFKNKEEVLALKLLVHHMGGSVRKEMNFKVTHLIAKLSNFCSSQKYYYAMTFRVPVVSENWVYDTWKNRDIVDFNATDADFISNYKLKAFHGSKMCFLGYPEEEKNHMIEVLKENGGEPTDVTDPACTHFVTDNSINPSHIFSLLSYPNKRPVTLTDTITTTTTTTSTVFPFANEEPSVPSKKMKISSDRVEKRSTRITKKLNRSAEKVSKPLSVLTEYNDNRAAIAAVAASPAAKVTMKQVKKNFKKAKKPVKLRGGIGSNVIFTPPSSAPSSPYIESLFSNHTPSQQHTNETPTDGDSSSKLSAYVEFLPSSYTQYRTPRNILDSASSMKFASSTPGTLNSECNEDEQLSSSIFENDLRAESFANRCAIDDTEDEQLVNGSVSTINPSPFNSNVLRSSNLSCVSSDFGSISQYHQDGSTNLETTVIDETKITVAPPLKSSKTFVVKTEWFWTSVQYEGRENEINFKFNEASNSGTPGLNSTPLCGTSSSRARKRKRRLRDKFSSFNSDLSPGSAQKRRSSIASDATRLSEGSFLDYTASPDIIDEVETTTQEKSKNSPRYQKFFELHQTETNYVGILRTIMTLFKSALEKMVDTDAELLNATELKMIFGHLPPIYTIHCCMLEELKQMASQWSEESSVGSLILKYSGDLVKAYPPFINFFEKTIEMLSKCDQNKDRFHAFLKVCQTKPECGRQSLKDLLIRPVQRLPSINLLLNDMLRFTSKNSVDYKALESAIISLQEVMTHINEDKRKTEGQVALFSLFNEIEKCPAHLVSSHRCLISRCEVTELSENLSGRGSCLVLFLFSDVIEVCKKRKSFHNLRSPKENGTKLYKHVELLSLNSVMKVVDIKDTEDCHNVFALMVKNCQELNEHKEKLFSFTITDESVEKATYLRTLCSQIAHIVCKPDPESYLTSLDAQQLDIDTSEISTGTLGRAFNKFATKTKIKVGRALSFNKTPIKLKRAVSTTDTQKF